MKKDIHPQNFRPVIFLDASTNAQFLINSTVDTTDTGHYEGKEFPLVRVEISSDSHPFYTGADNKMLDTAGRIDKFKARQAKAGSKAKK
jgi:large subunit ribosomal protein L31